MSISPHPLGTPHHDLAAGYWFATVNGEIDIDNADDVCAALLALARRVPFRAIVDCTGIEFIDVTGCRGLTLAHARATAIGAVLRYVAPSGCPLRRLLLLIDPGGRIPVYSSVEAAARATPAHGLPPRD
jgi:anti-anti-sigma regulatory factor